MSDWQAMAILTAAHTAGLEKLARLEQAAHDLQAGRAAQAVPVLRESLAFFEGELDRHFRHEEHALFPALARIIGRSGPVEAMLSEHETIWRSVDSFARVVEELEAAGDAAAKTIRDAAHHAHHIVFLLSGHIQREDSMLFPLAEQTLDLAEKEDVDHNIQIIDRDRLSPAAD